ncbi:MipA/OmpV family protein [Sphingorhabdus wooponensis]|jgi:outer membrane protein|uniref:MipA/OmpV family protein n=1 Tax=Sphingorhabdus wooponensis TaxID=940136 RepID=A0A3R8QA94_9SPHN|nr:MipA/OmpV family protein [Sphingorhabdus wooponensis]RRQ52575.1 MipA/OmpV family protein [Sphingorhabdus wooponensis]
MSVFKSCVAIWCASVVLCAPAFAQDREAPETERPNRSVFAGDWVTVGFGAGISPSYDGSDQYDLFPAPLVQGSVEGIDFGARGPGLYVDLIADGNSGKDVKFLAGPLVRFRMDRNNDIKDSVVRLLGKEDVAIEVGATAGVSFSKILHPFDSVSLSTDIQWDVAGAHKGRIISPSVSYATPLSMAIFTSFSLSATHVDGNYADTYFSIDQAGSIASGLPVFDAKGGWKSYGASLLGAVDLSGDARDGGWAIYAFVNYARLTNDAARSPVTSLRGDANQWFMAGGVSYTF